MIWAIWADKELYKGYDMRFLLGRKYLDIAVDRRSHRLSSVRCVS